tara:strand:- start:2584 stop:3513 length:930 start_codon:yes stop_codon:yes gene_type:complete
MSNELVVIKELDSLVVFSTGGAKSLVGRIRDEVMSEVYDLETVKGRKRIASRAFDVSKSKTALDKFGKDLADQLNAKLKPINSERKYARDELDKLRDEVRQPLTDWENEQQAIADKLAAEEAASLLAKQKESDHEIAILLDEKFESVKQAESELLAKQKAEYEAALKREAAEEATRLAEQQALAEKQRFEDERLESIRQQERANLEKEQAIKREQAQIEQAKLDAENAEKRRLADIETANRLNEERQEAEVKRLALEQKARDDDKEHRAGVNNLAASALMEFSDVTEVQAKAVVIALVKNQIPNAALTY